MTRLGLRHRPWLLVSAGLGVLTGVAARSFGTDLSASLLLGWCVAALAHMALTAIPLLRATPETIRRRAEQLDEGEAAILGASLIAAIAALGGAISYLVPQTGTARGGQIALALTSIAISWAFVHMLFAVRYAHEYWQQGGGLEFPGEEPPDFIDFLYVAATMGMAFATSDVRFCARRLRRLALLHGLVSFLFNVVIVSTAVNLSSELLN